MGQGTQSWCSMTTWVGSEVGGAVQERGDTCVLVANSCQLMAKTSQYVKVIVFQLK